MSSSPRLVIASNRLPFTVDRAGTEVGLVPACGGLAAALTAVHARPGNVWVGWPGDCSELDEHQRADLWNALRARRVVAVELTPPELVEYYDGICNSVLWPVLHYLIDRMPVALPDFHAYRAVNERFAESLVATYRDGDTIWIHDYHLLLTPALVRAQLPGARIGFFFHTPFPSADVFRVLPWRRELVDGVLGASLIGFQTSGDAANFAATVRLLTGRVAHGASFAVDARTVRFGTYPIGIDPHRFDADHQIDARHEGSALVSIQQGRKLLVGIDRLDYTKGILQRLTAFEQLLEQHPELRGTVEMLQVAVPSRDLVPSYIDHRQEVQECVERLNRRFETSDWTPVRYVLDSLALAQLREIYCQADVMLVTSLRDGMNLVAKEFVSCRTDDDGVLVLSEFAGAAEELRDALIVNPYSVDHLAEAIHTALTMGRDDRRRRMLSLRAQVATRSVHHWVDTFMADLASAPPPSASAADLPLTAFLRGGSNDGQPLSLIFVYEEALVSAREGTPVHPDPELLAAIRQITTRGIDVHIVSAADHAALGRWFEFVPVNLWAEHGLWHRGPDERRWRRTQSLDAGWTADLREFLEQFTARTPGSFVEERSTGFAWHFGRMDRATGDARSRELFAVLREAADAMGFNVTWKPSSIEVRPGGLSKEGTIQTILSAADASLGRLVVFERPGEGALRRVLRNSDVLVAIGASAASADHVLSSARVVRDVLESAFGSAEDPVGVQPRLDDRLFFPTALSVFPAGANSVAVSRH
jgi:trehalose 6-phosphate synthase/phosphatase